MAYEQIAFFGNCQALALSRVYQTHFAPGAEQTAYHVDAQAGDVAENIARLREADIVVQQQMDFAPKITAADFRPGVRVILFPMVVAGFLWPYGNQPHSQNTTYPFLPAGPYPSQLGDSFLNRLISKQVPKEEAFEKYMSLDIAKTANLDRLFELYMERQKTRDEKTEFAIADLIETHFRDEPLFITSDHPTLRIFNTLAALLFRRLGIPGDRVDTVLAGFRFTPFPQAEMPIHPKVAEFFGLNYIKPGQKYRVHNDGAITFEDYVRRYLDYGWNEPLQRGIYLARANRLEEALEQLTAGLALSEASVEGLLWQARTLVRLDRDQEALDAARQAVALTPDDPEVHQVLSRVLIGMKSPEKAVEAARRAVDLHPENADSHLSLADALSADGLAEDAVAEARLAVTLAPGDAAAHANLARKLVRSRYPDAWAEDALRRAIRLNPGSRRNYAILAEIVAKAGREAEAEAIRADPRAKPKMEPGELRLQRRQARQAARVERVGARKAERGVKTPAPADAD